MKLVLPSIIREKASWILISVLVSMEEVASSRISMAGISSITRVVHRSCFCPWLMLVSSSDIRVSSP